MKRIPIRNKNKKIICYARVDNCDKHFLNYRWSRHSCGYAVHALWIDGKSKMVYLHHAIMGRPLTRKIDHINGDPLDNTRKNLRIITQRENTLNKACHRNGRPPGAMRQLVKRKNGHAVFWQSRINLKGKSVFLGIFRTLKEASDAYKQAFDKNFPKIT